MVYEKFRWFYDISTMPFVILQEKYTNINWFRNFVRIPSLYSVCIYIIYYYILYTTYIIYIQIHKYIDSIYRYR